MQQIPGPEELFPERLEPQMGFLRARFSGVVGFGSWYPLGYPFRALAPGSLVLRVGFVGCDCFFERRVLAPAGRLVEGPEESGSGCFFLVGIVLTVVFVA